MRDAALVPQTFLDFLGLVSFALGLDGIEVAFFWHGELYTGCSK